MPSRPRRAAAQKANTAITDMVDSDTNSTSRSTRIMSSRPSRREGKTAIATITRGPPSSDADSNQHIHVTVKLPASKLRQATSSRSGQSSSGRQISLSAREGLVGGEIIEGKRNRSQKKSYVLDSSDDDDEDAEGEDDDMVDIGEEDAEGEIVVDDTMDLDAEGDDDGLGDEDADGDDDDMDLDNTPVAPTIKVFKPAPSKSISKTKPPSKPSGKLAAQSKDSDDDELSELDSEEDEIQDTVKVGGGEDDDEDAEGEEDDEIQAAGPAGEDDDDLLDSDDETGSRGETPDLTKLTKRQRARFEDGDGGLMKLSDEVQAKKHFTAEELSMRRAEMARRRRNLSEKRNEEVKMETINKLLKKQAPKNVRKSNLAGDDDGDSQRANPIFVRWTSNKDGNRIAVPDEMLAGPAGRVFIPGGLKGGKLVEEVS
ncbi:PAPA-1-like conserved region-domain-containing protein [Xylariales sp. AK1849]|nr:PAPA-1-like conserved region-domain-containing protein [Xylariales sp. AK1849]